MSAKLLTRKGCVFLATWALSAMVLRAAPPGGLPPGRSIEFSGSKADEGSTNLQQFNRSDALKELEREDQVRVPRDLFGNSMDGAPVPVTGYIAPVRSNRDKQRLDRKNRLELSPEEELLIGKTSSSDVLTDPEDSKDPDARAKAKRARADGFFERIDRRSDLPGSARSGAANRPGQYRDDDTTDPSADADLPAQVKDSAQGLKSLLAPEESDSALRPDISRDGFSDIFGLRDDKFSLREQGLLHKAHMEEYGQILGLPKQQLPGSFQANPMSQLANSLESLDRPYGENISSGMGFGEGATATAAPKFDTSFAPPSVPFAMPDVGGSGSGSLPGAGPATALQPVQDVAPPKPTFLAPRRPFL